MYQAVSFTKSYLPCLKPLDSRMCTSVSSRFLFLCMVDGGWYGTIGNKRTKALHACQDGK